MQALIHAVLFVQIVKTDGDKVSIEINVMGRNRVVEVDAADII